MTQNIDFSGHRNYLLIILAAFIVMVLLYGRIDFSDPKYSELDLVQYRAMAEAFPGIADTEMQPYCYRILTPWVVGLLPLPDYHAFYIIAIGSSLALVVLLYLFLCYQGISREVAMTTTVLFMFNRFFFGLNIWDYFQIVDTLSLLYLVALVWTMLKSRWITFGFVLLMGALTRETAMLMIPVSLFHLWERGKFRDEYRKWIAAIIPAIAVFVLLRFLIEPTGGLDPWHGLLKNVRRLGTPGAWFGLTVNGFIPLTFLPLVFLKKTITFFLENKYAFVLILIVFAGSQLGGENERLMAPSFIAFYPLIGRILQDHLYRFRGFMIVAVICAFISSLDFQFGWIRLPDKSAMLILTLACLAVVTLSAIFYRIQKQVQVLNRT